MSESHAMETRRRSRSKTPFLRSHCDHENCEHIDDEAHVHKKKPTAISPKVQTIAEEKEDEKSAATAAAAAASAAAAAAASKSSMINEQKNNKPEVPKMVQAKPKPSEQQSSESSKNTENKSKKISTSKKEELNKNFITSSSTTTTTTTTVIRKSTVGTPAAATGTGSLMHKTLSGVLSSTPKSLFEEKNSEKEISQNVINAEKEKSFLSSSFSRIFNRSMNSTAARSETENGDLSDHLAYREYKNAGEYWNTTPKTDYTYSELSKQRRVLAPGVVAMPNMSRRGLSNHSHRIESMIQQNPHQEDFIRRRYEYDYATNRRRQVNRMAYESGDELDNSELTKTKYHGVATKSLSITRFFGFFSSLFSWIWGSNLNTTQDSSLYRTYDHQNIERGFFGTIMHSIFTVFAGVYRYIYTFVGTILYWDTVALMSSSAVASKQNKKRFLLFLLMLLPLLLLTAYSFASDDDEVVEAETANVQLSQAFASLLPLTFLSNIKSSVSSSISSMKDSIQLPELLKVSSWLSLSSQGKEMPLQSQPDVIKDLKENMQKSLSDEAYQQLVDHINSYVKHLVELQVQENHKQYLKETVERPQTLSKDQLQIIVKLMQENLQEFARQQKQKQTETAHQEKDFTESEIQKLAELIRVQLVAMNWPDKTVHLTKENVEQIKKLIVEHSQLQGDSFYHLVVEKLDIEALLERLLSSPQLADFIDLRISLALKDQILSSEAGLAAEKSSREAERLHLQALNKEIDFIKLSLADKLSENADLHQSILKLQTSHEELVQRLETYELLNNQRLDDLLADLDHNLTSIRSSNFNLLNKQVKLTLVEILGLKSSPSSSSSTSTSDQTELSDADLKKWMHSIFVAKDFLEERLLSLQNATNQKLQNEIDRSSMFLMREINERLKQEILASIEVKQKESSSQLQGEIRAALSEEEVKNIVKSVLAIYDADKTGLVDFALETAGGSVLSTRCTESYQTKSAQISIFGIPLWFPSNTPRVAISPNVQPGECWAFQGFPGFLILKLNSLVYVTGFTLEHIPKSLSPTGRIESAPRNFTVWGLTHEKDHDPILFGEYEYVDNGASLQYFPLKNKDLKRPYEIVELRIETNHGHPQYTCLYRFRVHGKPPTS